MSMSKKDFVALADELRHIETPEVVLGALCRFCRHQNSQFNESRFRSYLRGECGPNGGKISIHKHSHDAAHCATCKQVGICTVIPHGAACKMIYQPK